MSYAWVSNPSKETRAIQQLKAEGKEVTEEAVLALYRRYGGLVIEKELASAPVELEDMKVADLRKLAKAKDIDVKGLNKAELVEALKDAK